LGPAQHAANVAAVRLEPLHPPQPLDQQPPGIERVANDVCLHAASHCLLATLPIVRPPSTLAEPSRANSRYNPPRTEVRQDLFPKNTGHDPHRLTSRAVSGQSRKGGSA